MPKLNEHDKLTVAFYFITETLTTPMPNKAAAKKAVRQTKKHTAYNQGVRAKVEIALRTARKALDAKAKEAATAVQAAIKTLDKAAQKGVLKANTASRLKSRLMKALHALKKK